MKSFNKGLAAILALVMLLGMMSFASADTALTEAPMLAQQVKVGALPAVENRMPAKADIMVEPIEDIGKYTSVMTLLQDNSKWGPGKLTEEALFRFKTDGSVEPNVAKGYEVNADSTVYTIFLREGMKWSDGVPFTAEDCRFFYEDLLIPGVTGKSVWEACKAGGELAKIAVIDDYTFTMTFAAPKPNFLKELAINGKWFFAPKHWLADKIPGENYLTAEQADAKAKELGYSDTAAMGNSLTYYYWLVKDRPTLRAWLINGNFNDELCVWTRNPYYWKTDAEGKQLPYIDEVHFRRFSDTQQALLWTLDGTADVKDVALADVETVLNSDADVNLVEWSTTGWSSQSMQLNQAILDLDLRALFQNVNFRHALSIAVNRAQIVELVDKGYTTASQAAPAPGAQGYSEEWSTKWIEYDVAGAQKLLETECGLKKDADGFYCFENGKRVVLNLQYQNQDHAAFAELLKNDFTALGIETTTRMYDRSIMEEMRSSNKHEVTLNWEGFDTLSISLRPDYFVPFRDYCVWGTAFGLWYKNHDNQAAVEPPEDVKNMLNVYDKMMASATSEEREAVALELLKIFEEGIYQIGFTSPLPTVYAVNAKLHNFLEDGISCDEFRNLGIAHAQNWWIEE